VKLLTLSSVGKFGAEESQDERQGKMLLHTEHSLLSLLKGMEGVVQKHDFFTELCLHEEEANRCYKNIFAKKKSAKNWRF
jgi:serine/threonine-protein kinase 40